MCHGAPVYQSGGADGPVLYRDGGNSGNTVWSVGDSSVLDYCGGSSRSSRDYLESLDNFQPGGGPPTATPYSAATQWRTGWQDFDVLYPGCSPDCGITVAAGGTPLPPPPVRATVLSCSRSHDPPARSHSHHRSHPDEAWTDH